MTRTISKTNPVRKYGRDARAIAKRIVRAARQRNAEALIEGLVRMSLGMLWTVCAALAATCFAVGFAKPHCFALAAVYAVLAWLVARSHDDWRES